MRTKTACLALACALPVVAMSSDDAVPSRFAPAFDIASINMAEGMAAQRRSMTPGTQHEMLSYFEGEWKTKMAITSMGQEMEGAGTSTARMVLDGRFLEVTGDALMPMLGRVRSLSYMGYDTNAKRYDLTQMSTSTTATLRATGLANESGTSIIFYGTMDEPMLGFRDRMVRYTFTVIDANTFEIGIDDLAIADPKNERVITITSTRAE